MLDDADAAEVRLFSEPALPSVSTSSHAFAAILDDLISTVELAPTSGDVGADGAGAGWMAADGAGGRGMAADGADGPGAGGVAAGGAGAGGVAAGAVGGMAAGGAGAGPEWSGAGDVSDESGPLDIPGWRPGGAEPGGARGTGASAVRRIHHVAPPPAVLRGTGDLVLVVGIGTDALTGARALADSIGTAEVRPGGSARSAARRVDDRRGALDARAGGVRRDSTVVVAFGLAHGAREVHALGEDLAGIAPDQVWVVVDASRKHEDTAAWVRAVDHIVAVDGVVVENSQLTATPGSVRALGMPIGWIDGRPVGIG